MSLKNSLTIFSFFFIFFISASPTLPHPPPPSPTLPHPPSPSLPHILPPSLTRWQLLRGRRKLLRGRRKLLRGRRELLRGRRKLPRGRPKLLRGRRKLLRSRRQLLRGRTAERSRMVVIGQEGGAQIHDVRECMGTLSSRTETSGTQSGIRRFLRVGEMLTLPTFVNAVELE